SDKYKNTKLKEIVKKLEKNIKNGQAYIKFCEWIVGQGGDVETIFNQNFSHEYIIKSDKSGYVNKIHTQKIGEITATLGAGRESLNDKIDYHDGVTLEVKMGDYVEIGQVVLRGRTNKNFDKNIKNEMSQVIEVD